MITQEYLHRQKVTREYIGEKRHGIRKCIFSFEILDCTILCALCSRAWGNGPNGQGQQPLKA